MTKLAGTERILRVLERYDAARDDFNPPEPFDEPVFRNRNHSQERRARKDDPERSKRDEARREVYRAIRAGRLRAQPCAICATQPTEAHHTDYESPLDVTWLCKKHHDMVTHGRQKLETLKAMQVRYTRRQKVRMQRSSGSG